MRNHHLMNQGLQEWHASFEKQQLISQPALEFQAGTHHILNVDSRIEREVSNRLKDRTYTSVASSERDGFGFYKPSDEGRTTTATTVVDSIMPAAREVEVAPIITGISVQHAKIVRKNARLSGIKLYINIQTAADSLTGEVIQLTAELKKHTRLREVKWRPDMDSPEFEDILNNAKESVKMELGSDGCLGRLHTRSRRDIWYQDSFAIGVWSDGKIVRAIVYVADQFFEIDMTQPMTANQERYFFSNGVWGTIVNPHRVAPRLMDAPRTRL